MAKLTDKQLMVLDNLIYLREIASGNEEIGRSLLTLVYNFNKKLLNEKENDYGKPKEKFARVYEFYA